MSKFTSKLQQAKWAFDEVRTRQAELENVGSQDELKAIQRNVVARRNAVGLRRGAATGLIMDASNAIDRGKTPEDVAEGWWLR